MYKTQCRPINGKDSAGPACSWGSSAEKLFWGLFLKEFQQFARMRAFESGKGLGAKEQHVQSSVKNIRAFLPLRMQGSMWPNGHRGTGVETYQMFKTMLFFEVLP